MYISSSGHPTTCAPEWDFAMLARPALSTAETVGGQVSGLARLPWLLRGLSGGLHGQVVLARHATFHPVTGETEVPRAAFVPEAGRLSRSFQEASGDSEGGTGRSSGCGKEAAA